MSDPRFVDPLTPEQREAEAAKARMSTDLHEQWSSQASDSFPEDVRSAHDRLMNMARRGMLTGDELNTHMMLLHGENHPLTRSSQPDPKRHLGPQFGDM